MLEEEKMVPADLLKGSAWSQLWRSIGYFIRRVADDRESLESLLIGLCVITIIPTIIVSLASCAAVRSLDDVEQARVRLEYKEQRGRQIEAMIDKGVPPAVADCIVDGDITGYCGKLRAATPCTVR